MLAADLVIQGTVLTVDELQPTAEALAVSDGRIIAVGERADIESWIGLAGARQYAEMVVLSADPRTVPPEEIADLEVRATFLAGRQVYAKGD